MEAHVWWGKSVKSGGKRQGTCGASSSAVAWEGRHEEEACNHGYMAAAWKAGCL